MISATLARLYAFIHWAYLYCVALHVIAVLAPHVHDDAAARGIASAMVLDGSIDDDDRFTEAQGLAGIAQESSFNASAVGKMGEVGLFQIWRGGPEMLDPVANARAGLAQMKISFRDCPSSPWAEFLGGPRGIHDAHVRRMSARRERLAGEILAIMNGGDLTAAEARR